MRDDNGNGEGYKPLILLSPKHSLYIGMRKLKMGLSLVERPIERSKKMGFTHYVAKWIGVMTIVRTLYEQFLRTALVAYVESTENDWDDNIVTMVDAIMYADYDTPKGGA